MSGVGRECGPLGEPGNKLCVETVQPSVEPGSTLEVREFCVCVCALVRTCTIGAICRQNFIEGAMVGGEGVHRGTAEERRSEKGTTMSESEFFPEKYHPPSKPQRDQIAFRQ